MATKGKDVGSAGKEKKGTSPSKPLQSGSTTKRSPKPSSNLDSTDKGHSSPSQKQIPSYLKPTISSSNIKKEDSNLVPSVQRRRSFDKPPSPTQIRKALLSPNRKRPARSSSVTPAKPSAAPKPVSDRNSRAPRLVKSQTTVAKTVGTKKATASNPPTNKEAGTRTLSAPDIKAPSVAETREKINNDSQHEDQDSLVHDLDQEEEVKSVDKVVEAEIPSDSSHIDVASSIEPNTTDQDEKLKPCETSTVVPENQDASADATPEDKICDQECKAESNSNHPEENSWDEPKVEDSQDKKGEADAAENPVSKEGEEPSIEDSGEGQNKGEEPSIEDSGEDQNKGEEPSIEDSGEDQNKGKAPSTEDSREDQNKDKAEEPEGDEGSQKHADEGKLEDEDEEIQKNKDKAEEPEGDEGSQKHSDEGKQEDEDEERQKNVVEEKKPKAVNGASKQQSASGKKDSQAQNEVIEEAASKLLEKRKNKVRALVGAFETVMSLQEPEA